MFSDRSAIQWIDSHCHLDMIDEDTTRIIQKASQQGVALIVTIGTDMESCNTIRKITKNYPSVYGTLGIHPHDASQTSLSEIDTIKKTIVNEEKIVALGECGLDYYYMRSPLEIQKNIFIEQLKAAEEIGYPVVIHSRDAEKDTMEILQPFLENKSFRAILHCFTSKIELAEFGKKYDCYFSFNGICTYKKSDYIREVLQGVDLERILLETDAPFLSPEPIRKEKNTPATIPIIGKFIAEFLNIEEVVFSKKIWDNTISFYHGLKQ